MEETKKNLIVKTEYQRENKKENLILSNETMNRTPNFNTSVCNSSITNSDEAFVINNQHSFR